MPRAPLLPRAAPLPHQSSLLLPPSRRSLLPYILHYHRPATRTPLRRVRRYRHRERVGLEQQRRRDDARNSRLIAWPRHHARAPGNPARASRLAFGRVPGGALASALSGRRRGACSGSRSRSRSRTPMVSRRSALGGRDLSYKSATATATGPWAGRRPPQSENVEKL